MTTTPQDFPIPKEDLPIWMRRAMRGNDYGALFALFFSVLVAWPFVIGTDLPQWNATENYVYMTADYAAALQEGHLYPRWAAYADEGYGAPIYHYLPPGAPYLSSLITAVFTGSAEASVRIVYLLAFMLAGVGTYGIVVRHRGAPAAVLAAVLYTTSPYFGLTSPYILGDLPGTLGLGLLPVLLWSVDRLLSVNHPQDFSFVTVVFCALLLTQPGLAASGVLLSACLGLWYIYQQRTQRYHVRLLFISFGLGALAVSFYWIPALAEQDIVRWVRHEETTRPLLLTLSGLLQRYHQADPLAIIPAPQLTFGWLRWLIVGLSVLGVMRVQRRFTTDALFLLAGMLTAVIALLLMPGQLWLLGVMTLCFSIASAAALSLREAYTEQTQRLVLAIVLLVILGASSPAWLPPVAARSDFNPSPVAQVEYEQSGYGVAVVPAGQAYPTTRQPNTLINAGLLDDLQADSLSRIARRELSSQMRINPLRQTSHSARYQVDVSSPRPLTMLRSYFPGWRASMDGQTLPANADPQTGLMMVQMPAATNQIMSVRLGATSVRRVAWVMSLAQLVLLIQISRRRYEQTSETYSEIALLTLQEARLIGLIFVFATLIVTFTANPTAPFSVRVQPGNALGQATILDSRSNVGISLLGYELSDRPYRAGEILDLTLYWSTLRELSENYRVQLSLYSETDVTALTKPATRYPGGYPPTRWTPNQYVRDPHTIALDENTPAGTYIVVVTLDICEPNALCDPNDRPIFFETDGTFIGRNYVLPQVIQVVR